MARQEQKIRTKAYIHVGDHLVDVDTLNPVQRDYVAQRLNYILYSEIFRGKATFEEPELPPRDEVFADF